MFVLIFAISARASVPPPAFILSQAAKSHDGIKTLALEGRITDVRTNEVFKEIMKIDFKTGRVVCSYLSATDQALGGLETQLKDIHRLGKFWLGVALDPNTVRFHQALQELNAVPQEKTEARLSRIGTQVTWAWGEESVIQFLKDEFLAFDYQTGGTGPNGQEILLKDYASSAVRVPRNAYVKLQGKDVYHFELKALKTNQILKYPSSLTPVSDSSAKEWTMLVR